MMLELPFATPYHCTPLASPELLTSAAAGMPSGRQVVLL